jgi:ABC-type transport system substrate-binding protein
MRRLSLALASLLIAGLVAGAPAASAPEQSPKHGGTVVFGPVAESACLNPLTTCGIGPQAGWIWEKVLPPAFAMAPDFTRRPALVSGAEIVSKQPFTLVYHIRPAARWSDGVPVTARDFRFTHRAIVEYELHRLVRLFRVMNSKTFKVVLSERVADWRGMFPLVLPRHALAGHDLARIWADGIDDPSTGRPIGSGPFLVSGWDHGKQLTLVRNPRYWGPHTAYLDRLIIRFCQAACQAPSPTEVVETMRTGAVDFTYARDSEIVPDLRRIRSTTVRLQHTNGWEHLTLRLRAGGHPALRLKLVRQAIAYGIDRGEIARRLWGVIDPTFRPLHSAVFLGSARHYRPNWEGYAYRPGLARSLLERAGCRPGTDGIYSCGGERLSLRFYTSLGTSQRVRAVELMREHLRRAGIEVVLSYAVFSALIGIVESGEFDAASYAWVRDTGYYQKLTYGCGGPNNESGYCQRLVTADLDQAERILDDAHRARVLNRVDRQLARDIPLIPLYQIPWVYAFRDSLRNVVPSADNLFWNAENWWLAE